MVKKWKARALFILLILLTIAFSRSIGLIPPLGKLLSPYTGFWQNAETRIPEMPEEITSASLHAPVRVKWDYNMVPHIFAGSEEDLMYAQGYVTASMRLFQMEFFYRQAAGRLSELMGHDFINSDRFYRRMGLKRAAEQTLDTIKKDPHLYNLLEQYSRGVNDYIHSLSYRQLPLEYKVLAAGPEDWSPLNILLIQKHFAYGMTGFDADLENTNTAAILGETAFLRLFYSFLPKDIPACSPRASIMSLADSDTSHLVFPEAVLKKVSQYRPVNGIGSNSLAISGRKTYPGLPVLCNEAHAPLKIPGMWFDIQMSTPSGFVYGASIPGIPFVFMGMNEHLAWGRTNSVRDFKDWYSISFTNSQRTRYQYKGSIDSCILIPEHIIVRGAYDFYDTVRITKAGPLIHANSMLPDDSCYFYLNLAVDWVGQEVGRDIEAFYRINKASTTSDFTTAVQLATCPGFNFTLATRTGDVGLFHQGKFLNHKVLHGTTLMDVNSKAEDKSRWIPQSANPFEMNPAIGFVLSTNQSPTDSTYPYWYGGTMEYYRNRRIHKMLTSMNRITPESNKAIQNDNFYLLAAEVLPVLLKNIQKGDLKKPYDKYYRILQDWDLFANPQSKSMTLFTNWWNLFRQLTWDELNQVVPTSKPPDAVLAHMLISDPGNPVFDLRSTTRKETAADLIRQAFQMLPSKLTHIHEIPVWSAINNTQLDYYGINAFSVKNLKVGGYQTTINMNTGNKGVVYRMIISLEDEPFAWGVYPGGQSGNPGSYFFNNLTESWATGNYYDWLILKSENETNKNILFEQELRPGR